MLGNHFYLAMSFKPASSMPGPCLQMTINFKLLTEGPMAMDTSHVGLKSDKADSENLP